MAEPKDDPDVAHFVQKVANHLGNSRLEENLNDFFEMYHEELTRELEPRSGIEGGGHSLRVHELYQEFLAVVQANLEEFLQAEGLTEAELRDACEKEMELEDPGGLNFMQALTSSWELSSFVALASDFVEEEEGSNDFDHDCTTVETEALDSHSPCADSGPSLETAGGAYPDKRGAIGDQHGFHICISDRASRCLLEAGGANGDRSRENSREYSAAFEVDDHHALVTVLRDERMPTGTCMSPEQCEPIVVETPLRSSNYGREGWAFHEQLSTEAQEKF